MFFWPSLSLRKAFWNSPETFFVEMDPWREDLSEVVSALSCEFDLLREVEIPRDL